MLTIAGNVFVVWIMMAVLCKWVVDILKAIFPWLDTSFKIGSGEKEFHVEWLVSILVAGLLCFGANLDFFNLLGIEYDLPWVGLIIGLLVIASGSSGIHDLWGLIKAAVKRFMDEHGDSISSPMQSLNNNNAVPPFETENSVNRSAIPPPGQ